MILSRLPVLRSLRAKLTGLLVLVGLVPLAAVGVIAYTKAAGEMRHMAGTKLADVAFNASDKLDRNLFERYGDWDVVTDILGAVQKRADAGGAHTLGLTLLNHNGVVLSGERSHDTLTRTIADSPIAKHALQVGASGFAQGRSLAGNRHDRLQGHFHSVGYSIYPGIGWSVVAGQDRAEALAAAASLRTKTLVVALLTGIGALLVARRLTRPIEELVNASEAAATGDLTVRSGVAARSDELGRLARAFDARRAAEGMALTIHESVRRAEESAAAADEARSVGRAGCVRG